MIISFIIVGKNEGKTLRESIESVFRYVDYNNVLESDVIYVDSQSTDDSLQIAKEFDKLRVFLISGVANSAIARNIGANESRGSVLIFLDADMEIDKYFHSAIISGGNIIHPFISGRMQNVFYDKDGEFIESKYLPAGLVEDRYESISGGYFVITKKAWVAVGGMKTRYRRSQDLDLSLRLAKNNILLLRKKELFVKHHTVDYLNESRIWAMLLSGAPLYGTSMLYREHLTNKHMYKFMVRRDYTMIMLVASLFFSVALTPWILLTHPIVIVLRVFFQEKVARGVSYFNRIAYFYFKDVLTVAGLLLFFPKNKKIKYRKIQ